MTRFPIPNTGHGSESVLEVDDAAPLVGSATYECVLELEAEEETVSS